MSSRPLRFLQAGDFLLHQPICGLPDVPDHLASWLIERRIGRRQRRFWNHGAGGGGRFRAAGRDSVQPASLGTPRAGFFRSSSFRGWPSAALLSIGRLARGINSAIFRNCSGRRTCVSFRPTAWSTSFIIATACRFARLPDVARRIIHRPRRVRPAPYAPVPTDYLQLQ